MTMAVPVAISLLLLARLAAQRGWHWAVLAAARLRALERLELLSQGLAPSLPQACVRVRLSAPPRLGLGSEAQKVCQGCMRKAPVCRRRETSRLWRATRMQRCKHWRRSSALYWGRLGTWRPPKSLLGVLPAPHPSHL